jgi:hypothetical protein
MLLMNGNLLIVPIGTTTAKQAISIKLAIATSIERHQQPLSIPP